MTDPFGGGFDPRMFEQIPLFRELAKVMSWTKGPVNWDLALQTAESFVADSTARSDRDEREFADAVNVAELWLDQATGLQAVNGPVRSLTPREWVAQAATGTGLGLLVEPLAAGMGQALSEGMPEQLRAMEGQPGFADALQQSFGAMGAMMYGVQVGTIAGNLSGQLLGSYDLGVPVINARTVATVGTTHEQFARDYDVEPAEMRYWLALRESTFRRIWAGVNWLQPHLASRIAEFATAADFNPEQLMQQLGTGGLDPSNIESLSDALGGSDFAVEPTAAQRQVLGQLQALVAFVEAYAEVVVATGAGGRLGALTRIEEAMRRRRAAQGPGERTLHQLIGLDLVPRQIRDARAFCDAVIEARGQEGLDRVWHDAGRLPTSDDFAEPSRWLVRMAAVELDDPESDAPATD